MGKQRRCACGPGLSGGDGGLLGGEEADARVVGGELAGGGAKREGSTDEAVFGGGEFYGEVGVWEECGGGGADEDIHPAC